MFRKTLGLTFASLFSTAALMLLLFLPQAQSTANTGGVITNSHIIKSSIYRTVTPVKTMQLRDMKHLDLPPVMRQVIGNRSYTQQQIEQLRAKLFASGDLKPAPAPYLLPLKKLTPVGGTHKPAIYRSLQSQRGKRLDFTSGYAFPGIGASDSPEDPIGCAPPDTDNAVGYDSAVGNDVVVELVNTCGTGTGVGAFKVWNASDGSVIQGTTSLGGLWSTSDCQDGGGDNQVNYDQFAHRWWMSQFNSSYTGICVAISESDDPTGAYYLYDMVIDPSGFTDYPKMGKWVTGDDNIDAYMVSTNDFLNSGDVLVNFVAMQRSAMLTGSTAGLLVIEGTGLDEGGLDFSALPADVDGTTMPPSGAPGIFVDYISPYYYGGGTYALEMWTMSVDWSTTSASLTGPTEIDVDPFNDGDYSCAPQPSPGECLPTLGDRLMYRLAYRNGYTGSSNQVLLTNHAVTTNGTSAPIGIDWYELTAPTGSTDASDWGIAQQAVYAPADGNSRFMGSISMDHVGNLALGYTISSSTMDASAAVTGQNVGAPSDTMDAAEQILITGSGVQEATGRWGDYSSMMASATDDCTFWTALEYISNTGSFLWSTSNSALKFSNCSIGPTGTITGQVTDSGTSNPIAGAKVTLTPGGSTATTNSSGVYTTLVPVNTYDAAFTKFGYTPGSISGIDVTDGGTVTENIALTSAPSATISGNVDDGTPSGHTYGLYAHVTVTSPGFGTVANFWTNPQGAYSVTLPEGSDYTLSATAYLPGYNPGSATVTDLSGNTSQNVGLTVGSSCAAPGYAFLSGFGQDFDEGFPPTGWTITNDYGGSPIAWDTNTNWEDDNYTGGSGIAATADSNNADFIFGYEGSYDTSIVTPEISVASLGPSPVMQFNLNYQEYSGTDAMDVDVSGDGGMTWSNLAHINTNYGSLYTVGGANYMVPVTIPSGATQILLRWRYYDLVSGFDWYAQIDNVSVGACAPIAGGLVEGNVTDLNTGGGIKGATVADSNSPSNSTKTFTNALDSNLPAAYYFLFSNSNGSDVITASDAGYGNGTATLNVTDDSVTQQDFALGAPEFNATPAKFNLHVMVGTTDKEYLTINNTGNADGTYSFLTFNNPPPSGIQGGSGAPLDQIQCTRLAPQSVVWLQQHYGKGGGYNPNCQGGDDDSPTKGSPSDPAWASITDYPGGIMDNAAAEDETTGLVYSVGGVDGSGTTTAAGNVYNPNTQTWTAIAPLPAASEKPAAAFIGGKLYVADGWDSLGNPTATLRIYDPSSNTWSTGANNPAPEGGGVSVAVMNNKIYLIGGCPNGSSCGDTPFVSYDPSSDTWTTLAPYPQQISWESCGAVQGTLYCAGGTAGSSEYANGYAYDASSNSWSAIAPIPVSSGGLWASGYIGTSQGLLVSGGVTNNFATITNIGFVYAPSSNTWTPLPNSINSLYRGGSACGFYKVGGSTGGFIGEPDSEVLAGNTPCGSSPIPWLVIKPATGTVPAGGSVQVKFKFLGTGQQEYTKSQAYVLLGGTPYAPQQIDLKVHWDPQPIDLKVKATADVNTVPAGGIVVYAVTVKNKLLAGHGQASGTTMTYSLPAGAFYFGAQGPATCTIASGVVTCAFGTLAQGVAETENLFVTPSRIGTLSSTFSVIANEPDDNLANNQVTVNTTVVGVAHVTLDSYTVSRNNLTLGGQVTYNLGISNKGPDKASGLTVMAPLPASMKYVSSTASAGSCSNSGGLVTCKLGELAAGAKATVSIRATVNGVGRITTMARVSADSRDPNVTRHSATTSITVNAAAKPPSAGGEI